MTDSLAQQLRQAIEHTTWLFFNGCIAYTTQTQMTEDIAKIFGMNHRDVQVLCDRLYEKWEEEGAPE